MPSMEPVKWECPDCGTDNTTPFGSATFSCAACGYELDERDAIRVYMEARKRYCSKSPLSGLEQSPFHDDAIPDEVSDAICAAFSQFKRRSKAKRESRWSEFSYFDLLWIATNPDMPIDRFPLQCIDESHWRAIGKRSNNIILFFCTKIAEKDSVEIVEQIIQASRFLIPVFERLISSFGWSRWSRDQGDRLAVVLFNRCRDAGMVTVVEGFSPETKYKMWRKLPEKTGIAVSEFLSLLNPAEVARAMKRGEFPENANATDVAGKWTKEDWLAVMAADGIVLPEGFKHLLDVKWAAFDWKLTDIASVLDANGAAFNFFSGLSETQVSGLLHLRPDFAPELLRIGAFAKINTTSWKDLLADKSVFAQGAVRKYALETIVPALSADEAIGLVRKNHDTARLFLPDSLPDDLLAELFLDGTNGDYFNGFDFLGRSKEFWIEVLSRCGNATPSGTATFFLQRGNTISDKEMERMLRSNPFVLDYLSPSEIAKLSAETFLSLCNRLGAPDFLVTAYPVQALLHETQIEFLRKYPWAEKSFDWKSWPIGEVKKVLECNPMLEREYSRKRKLFFARHWKTIFSMVALFVVLASATLYSIAAWKKTELQHSIERDNAKRVAAEIEKNKRLKAEANERAAASNLAAAIAEAETAKEKRLAADSFLQAEEVKRDKAHAKAVVDKARADADKAKADARLENDRRKTAEAEAKMARAAADEARSNEKANNARIAEAAQKAAEANQIAETIALEREQIAERERNRNRDVLYAAIAFLREGRLNEAERELAKVEPRKLDTLKQEYHDANQFLDKMKQAQSGNAEAALWIGNQFAETKSQVVLQDEVMAVKWFEKAMKMGNVDAMRLLGFCYKNGRGVSLDEGKAADWYRKAFEQGDWKAGVQYGCYLLNGGFKLKSKDRADQKRAYSVFIKCAENDNADALYYRGVCRYFGYGCEADEYLGKKDMREARAHELKNREWDWLLKTGW